MNDQNVATGGRKDAAAAGNASSIRNTSVPHRPISVSRHQAARAASAD